MFRHLKTLNHGIGSYSAPERVFFAFIEDCHRLFCLAWVLAYFCFAGLTALTCVVPMVAGSL